MLICAHMRTKGLLAGAPAQYSGNLKLETLFK
jgi:hypothetical protein